MTNFPRILAVAMGLSACTALMASADGLHTYRIDAMKVTEAATEAPMKDKEIALTLSYQGKHESVSRVVSAQTDAQGLATITFDESAEDQDFMKFAGVTQFCGKFDGPHYCGTLSTDLNTELNGEKVELAPDSHKHVKYDCEIEHNPGFLTDTSTIHILCRTAK